MHWRKNKSIVPVLMFHSVGIRNDAWVWSSLSESLDVFEQTLVDLKDRGYRTVNLEALFKHMSGVARLPENSIVLTFDDGYLDNWVFVAPLLRKYGMNGVVYVTSDFVQNSDNVRPTIEDVWASRVNATELETYGFMNWSELRQLDQQGILDVQCHALTHTWYFAGPQVEDFHRPRDVYPYPWLSWNARPDRKPYYLNEDQQEFVPWGYPVFEHEKSMVVRRFFPDQARIDEIVGYVNREGAARFFDRLDWRNSLTSKFPDLGCQVEFSGRVETDGEYRERVLQELAKSKQILEARLEKTVSYLSWPGGGVNDAVTELAREVGFESWTLSSWQNPSSRNLPGSDPAAIKRVTGHDNVHWRGKWIANGGAWWIVHRVLTHQGSLVSKVAGALRKVLWIAGVSSGARVQRVEGPE